MYPAPEWQYNAAEEARRWKAIEEYFPTLEPTLVNDITPDILALLGIPQNGPLTANDLAFLAGNTDYLLARASRWMKDNGYPDFGFKERPIPYVEQRSERLVTHAGNLGGMAAKKALGAAGHIIPQGVKDRFTASLLLNALGQRVDHSLEDRKLRKFEPLRGNDEILPPGDPATAVKSVEFGQAMTDLATCVKDGLEVGWTPKQILGGLLKIAVTGPPAPPADDAPLTRAHLGSLTNPPGNLALFGTAFPAP